MTEDERRAAIDVIAADPSQGAEVQGSGGVRKLRIAGKGKGKSGGYRIMVAYVGEDAPAYLLAVLGKGQRANFTDREIAAMKDATAAIKLFWRRRSEP